jgi:alpha-galactosidase
MPRLVGVSALAIVTLFAYGVISLFPDWIQAPAAQSAATETASPTFSEHRHAVRPAPVQPPVTPPMGWNGFNHFYLDVGAATVEAEARALVTSGMAAAGYTYVDIDGGWDMPDRGPGGALVPVPFRFPQGMKPVADYVHGLGLKFGIYASAGTRNCAGTSAGSYGHYAQDAEQFATWGVDYVKLDWCRIPYGDFRHLSHQQVSKMLAARMAAALAATGRAMVLDLNVDSEFAPWSWANGIATIWRTGKDSHDRWASLLWNFQQNVRRYPWAGPGHYNDPDMLEVGNGGMNVEEYRTQFSLWAEMAAPLIAGNDLTAMPPAIQRILTNHAVIAVDQDPLGLQGRPVAESNRHWVLAKPLAGGAVAVVLFNETGAPATISTSMSQLGLAAGSEYTLVDLWSGVTGQTTGLISATVAPHGVVMYEVNGID